MDRQKALPCQVMALPFFFTQWFFNFLFIAGRKKTTGDQYQKFLLQKNIEDMAIVLFIPDCGINNYILFRFAF